MRIGVLTSGGDAPGLNAVIRGIVHTGHQTGADSDFIGFRNGWRGLVESDAMLIERRDIMGIHKLGGTILGASRTNPFEHGGVQRVREVMRTRRVDALIAVGGEGTLAAAKRLTDAGIPIVGVPKTIDNDLSATDYTFGFDTAVQVDVDAMDRLRTTGDAHGRCMIAEVMGRHVGWIALHSGMAAGAHAILIPEKKTGIEQICTWVLAARDRGRAPLIVVAEGFTLPSMEDAHSERGLDAFGRPRLGGIGERLAPLIEERTGIETRATTLGHVQRGGTPTAYDRVLATRLGMAAFGLARTGQWGHMVALRGTSIVTVSFEDALGELKTVPDDRYEEARMLFG